MFDIFITQLRDCCWQLEGEVRTLALEIEETENCISSLGSMSGMENVLNRLKQNRDSMQEEQHLLKELLLAMNKILLNYTCCEKRIVDECNRNAISFATRDISFINISRVSKLIS